MKRLPIADCRLPIADCRLPIADCRLPIADSIENGARPMDSDELKKRTKAFGLRAMRVADALPNTMSGRAVGNQLVRSGLSVGANYRAACRGRSRAEFIAKLGISEEEADESDYWLEVIAESGLLPRRRVEPLREEAVELVRTLAASRITASRSRRK